MTIVRADDEDSMDINAFDSMEEELKLLEDQTNHCLAKLEGTMFNSAQVETLHNVIALKKN